MKKIVLLVILNGSFVFCKAQDIAAFRKDPDIIELKKITNKLKSRYYKMPNNYASLQAEIMKTPTPENMKSVLKKNGMVNADQFVDDITSQRNSMLRFNQKHPEFKTMDPSKRMELMKQLLTND